MSLYLNTASPITRKQTCHVTVQTYYLFNEETEFRDHATGIQAPDMIQREMTADEDDIKQEKINVSNKPEVSLNELKFKELQVDEKTMEEEKSSSNGK